MIKRLVLMLVLLSMVAVSSAAFAEAPKDKGPEVIRLKMGDMELPFKHWKHQKATNNECFHCHNTKIGKIDNWGKDTAHKVCIACHELEDKGPVSCRQCHVKPKKK
ncbi:MAG TPA: cytochrome c3 family protein [Geomonas sp.]